MVSFVIAVLVSALTPSAGPYDHLPLRNVHDGRPIELADLRGRVVVVDVWATWCAPCLADLPRLRQLHRTEGGRIAVVGINLDRMARRDLVAWMRRHDVDWPQHADGRGYGSPVARDLGIVTLPVTLLLGADGRLVAKDLRGDALVNAARALARRPPRQSGTATPPTRSSGG